MVQGEPLGRPGRGEGRQRRGVGHVVRALDAPDFAQRSRCEERAQLLAPLAAPRGQQRGGGDVAARHVGQGGPQGDRVGEANGRRHRLGGGEHPLHGGGAGAGGGLAQQGDHVGGILRLPREQGRARHLFGGEPLGGSEFDAGVRGRAPRHVPRLRQRLGAPGGRRRERPAVGDAPGAQAAQEHRARQVRPAPARGEGQALAAGGGQARGGQLRGDRLPQRRGGHARRGPSRPGAHQDLLQGVGHRAPAP